jgi:uncharacterized protein DUF4185
MYNKPDSTKNNLLVFSILLLLSTVSYAQSPYPPSKVIANINFDWANYNANTDRLAPGSDNFPVTWADDNNQYTAWGDGGGFGGTNSDARVSLGIGRVSGDKNNYTTANVWGGKNTENPATFGGKSYGIISIDTKLYMWVGPGTNTTGFEEQRMYESIDHGATWKGANWKFVKSDGFIMPTFLQFGKAYAGARDNFVYSYANNIKDVTSLRVQIPGEITLMRTPKNSVMDRSKYEFYKGSDAIGNAIWTKNINERQPVFKNPEGVGWNTSVSYNAGLNRYLLTTEHVKSFVGNIGIFDAPNPWGPWTTVLYDNNFGTGYIPQKTFFFNFSNKWLSADGKRFVLIFTGIGELDSWNVVEGYFTTNTGTSSVLDPPTGLQINIQ